MSSPTIAVVIPAYQVEPWIERCLRSVLDQSVPSDEVIVVDDGSTDRTADMAAATPGVRVGRQENQGPAVARNTGAGMTSTDWIFFLDADDMLLPGAVATFQEAIAGWPGASVINPAFETEYPDGRVVRPSTISARVYGRAQLPAVIRRNPFVGNALIKRDVVQSYPYDVSFHPAEDLDLWFRLLLDSHEIVRMGIPTMRRLVGRSGALSNQVLRMRRTRLKLFQKLWLDRRTSVAERALLAYQITRVSTGIATARTFGGAEG